MPLSWGWQLQLRRWQRHLSINGNNAIMTRAMMPAWQQATRVTMLAQQQWRCLCNDNSNNAIVTRATIAGTMAKMLAHWRWQCQHDKGNNTSLTTSYKGNKASLTTVDTPVHQQRQWHHHNDGKDACALTMATTPLLQGQQCQLDAWWVTRVYFFAWLDRLFEQNRFFLTFPTGKGRSGWMQLYWFQHDTKQLCTPLDWLGGGGLTSRGERATLAILVWPQREP